MARCSLPAAGLGHLPSNPLGGWICRHAEPHQSDAAGAEKPKGRRAAERRASAQRTGRSTRCRRHGCEERSSSPGTALAFRRAMYFATLVWPTSMPSLSSSPWMRGAPQSGLARLMSRISRRISSGTSVSRRAVWISNARTIETQHGANEPRSQAGRWPAHLKYREQGDTAQRTPVGRRAGKQISSGNCAAAH